MDDGRKVFSASTRDQVARSAARILKKQPATAKNSCVYVASFEVDMNTWFNAHKEVLGSEGWRTTSISSDAVLERSQEYFKAGNFTKGYTDSALAVCTGTGFENHFSEVATLANKELDLPEENLVEVVRHGLSLPNPFA